MEGGQKVEEKGKKEWGKRRKRGVEEERGGKGGTLDFHCPLSFCLQPFAFSHAQTQGLLLTLITLLIRVLLSPLSQSAMMVAEFTVDFGRDTVLYPQLLGGSYQCQTKQVCVAIGARVRAWLTVPHLGAHPMAA